MVVALGALVLVMAIAVLFLGRSASTKWSAIGDGSPSGMQHIPLPGDSDYTGTTAPGLEGTAVGDVGTLTERLCSSVSTNAHSINPQPEFHSLEPGDDEQYAQVVVRSEDVDRHLASVELASGSTEELPDEDRLYTMGRRSTVLVCGIPDRSDQRHAVATCTASNGIMYRLYAVSVHLQAFELRTGRELVAGDVTATVPACPPDRPASALADVTTAQLTGWVAAHLKEGAVR